MQSGRVGKGAGHGDLPLFNPLDVTVSSCVFVVLLCLRQKLLYDTQL